VSEEEEGAEGQEEDAEEEDNTIYCICQQKSHGEASMPVMAARCCLAQAAPHPPDDRMRQQKLQVPMGKDRCYWAVGFRDNRQQFHLACVNIAEGSELPKTWYCKECLAARLQPKSRKGRKK
jgi:hypothetical protein